MSNLLSFEADGTLRETKGDGRYVALVYENAHTNDQRYYFLHKDLNQSFEMIREFYPFEIKIFAKGEITHDLEGDITLYSIKNGDIEIGDIEFWPHDYIPTPIEKIKELLDEDEMDINYEDD